MIDEKKLIDGSTWYPNTLMNTASSHADGWNNCNRDWIKRIEEQPKVGEWIPVSERLPEVYEDSKTSDVVLVCGYDKECDHSWQAMGFYVHTEAIKRWFFAECINTDEPIDWIDIVAWMPLPESYKGEE